MGMFKSTDGRITLRRGGDVRDDGWWCELAADWRGVVQEGAEAQKTGQLYWGNINPPTCSLVRESFECIARLDPVWNVRV